MKEVKKTPLKTKTVSKNLDSAKEEIPVYDLKLNVHEVNFLLSCINQTAKNNGVEDEKIVEMCLHTKRAIMKQVQPNTDEGQK